MSYIDSATELLDRTETSLHSLIMDALKARAYREIAGIAALAEQVSNIVPSRSGSGRKTSSPPEVSVAAPAVAAVSAPLAAEAVKGAEPFWMRPKS